MMRRLICRIRGHHWDAPPCISLRHIEFGLIGGKVCARCHAVKEPDIVKALKRAPSPARRNRIHDFAPDCRRRDARARKTRAALGGLSFVLLLVAAQALAEILTT